MKSPGATPKRQRTRLAKSELWLLLAMKAQEWADDIAKSTRPDAGITPFERWGAEDVFVDLATRYGLSPADLARLLTACANELENRAERSGYGEAWR
jgi:hypothetical protein